MFLLKCVHQPASSMRFVVDPKQMAEVPLDVAELSLWAFIDMHGVISVLVCAFELKARMSTSRTQPL